MQDILAVDVSPKMLAALSAAQPEPPPSLGNAATVRTWLGDICELPNHQGRAQCVFMNAVFGNMEDQRAALLKSCILLNASGRIVISHPFGVRCSCLCNSP